MPARTQRSRCIGLAAWLILAALMLSVSCARHLGLRLNTTSSLPMGLWRLTSLLKATCARRDRKPLPAAHSPLP